MKKRRKMSKEQKAAAAERLKKAREAKYKKAHGTNMPKHSGVHPDVLALPDDHYLGVTSVKHYISVQEDLLKGLRALKRRGGEKKTIAQLENTKAYIKQMKYYLKTSIWSSIFYGENCDKIVPHLRPKRTVIDKEGRSG